MHWFNVKYSADALGFLVSLDDLWTYQKYIGKGVWHTKTVLGMHKNM